MDLDALIRDADPGRDLIVAAVEPARAQRARRRADAHGRRRSHRVALVAGALLLGSGAAALGLGGGSARRMVSPAAVVLVQAGQAASATAPVKLNADQYFYDEVKALTASYYPLDLGAATGIAYVTQRLTLQSWGSTHGPSCQVLTYDGPQQFVTPGSQEGVDAGEPALGPALNTPFAAPGNQGWIITGQIAPLRYSHSTPWGRTARCSGPGLALAVPDDLSRLPTREAALRRLIATNATGLDEVVTDPSLPASPAYIFSTAAEILATPAFGSSAALRIALCRIMASVPGIELIGAATDESGRRGIAVAGPLGGDGSVALSGDRAVREEAIIDPATGAVLQLAQVITNPALESAQFRAAMGGRGQGRTIAWTDYLTSGVVNSPTATLPLRATTAPAA